MSDSVDRILKASPKKLAEALDLGTSPAKVWLPNELEAVFRHQMSAPVSADLTALGPEVAGRLEVLTDAQGLLLKSFGDLFQHPQPPLQLLELVKDFAKMNRARSESLLPNEIAAMLYYLSIAAALTKLGKRISSLSNDEIRLGLRWGSSQRWIDEPSRRLLETASNGL